MSDYNAYVTAVNKIFDYIAKMKAGMNSQDNLNYIESIEEYKTAVIGNADIFKTPAAPIQETSNSEQTQETTQPAPEQLADDSANNAPEQLANDNANPVPDAEQPKQEQAVVPDIAVTPESLSQNVEALGND